MSQRWGTDRTAQPAWRKLRLSVLTRDNYRCRYCGRAGADTVDHVVPVFRGGSDDESNLVAACRPCHASKTGREARSAQPSRKRPPERHPGLLTDEELRERGSMPPEGR
ncbi:MAG: HNH endonuclease [Actinomycetota bacterium]|nr:HNH endonuclease [Actinomycetota bacterium]